MIAEDLPELILGCGGRGYRDRDRVRAILAEYVPDHDWVGGPRLICGARYIPKPDEEDVVGADELIAQQGVILGFSVWNFPAQWASLGKRAGFERNLEMLDERPDLVVAFPGGKGTAHTVGQAEHRGITVRRIDRD